ncbi:MAG: hypothetical protein V9E87_14120 [Gemmatimonadales bacterium]
MSDTPGAWFAARTEGAPARLLEASTGWWDRAAGATPGARLAMAGHDALEAAIASGATRDAALDLLAADALITLALLAEGEADPMSLRQRAVAIRAAVTSA